MSTKETNDNASIFNVCCQKSIINKNNLRYHFQSHKDSLICIDELKTKNKSNFTNFYQIEKRKKINTDDNYEHLCEFNKFINIIYKNQGLNVNQKMRTHDKEKTFILISNIRERKEDIIAEMCAYSICNNIHSTKRKCHKNYTSNVAKTDNKINNKTKNTRQKQYKQSKLRLSQKNITSKKEQNQAENINVAKKINLFTSSQQFKNLSNKVSSQTNNLYQINTKKNNLNDNKIRQSKNVELFRIKMSIETYTYKQAKQFLDLYYDEMKIYFKGKVEVLGIGSFGTVFKFFDEKYNANVAIKCLEKGNFECDYDNSEIIALMILEKHENVVEYFYSIFSDNLIFIVLDYVEYSLCEFNGRRDLINHFMKQLIAGVKFIHSKHIMHRDLKPENILVTKDLVLKISDFGSCCIDYGVEIVSEDLVATYQYRAPELFHIGLKYTSNIDVFAIGIIAYKLYTCHFMVHGRNMEEYGINLISLLADRFEFYKHIHEYVKDTNLVLFIFRCCHYNPYDRFTIDEAYQEHQFESNNFSIK